MKRRICLVGLAVTAVPFAIGISVAAAASKSTKPASKPLVVKCHLSLGTLPPAGSPSVEQPPSQGAQYGPVHCGGASLGWGVEKNSFKVPDSGDSVGSYAQYFGTGSLRGRFDLTPIEQTLSPTDFTSEAWTGTVTVTGGTGTLAKAKGKKGTLKCTSADSVHLACTEKIKLARL